MKRFLWLLLLVSCTDLKTVKEEEIRRKNATREPLVRTLEDVRFPIFIPLKKTRTSYPWESANKRLVPLSPEDLRCKGSPLHPSRSLPVLDGGIHEIKDCTPHSLPKMEGEEVYSKLILEKLNLIQRELGRQVLITSGHRCPIHNIYCNPTGTAVFNKHLVAARVDFIVQTDSPEEVVDILRRHSKDKFTQAGDRLQWNSSELSIQWTRSLDLRDFDNRHNLPYFTIEDHQMPLTWDLAFSVGGGTEE